ncbi:hypothetical protein GCM10009530_35300 [Microbispora corallina]|uniref:Uncharacterized protein n=1 Tax=Microbispora corallina TaxID=83302 RepID=A0ABQ4FYN2_9ACTN|nr:hypothetical protein Mco01_29340 [Microbispora corallina]
MIGSAVLGPSLDIKRENRVAHRRCRQSPWSQLLPVTPVPPRVSDGAATTQSRSVRDVSFVRIVPLLMDEG